VWSAPELEGQTIFLKLRQMKNLFTLTFLLIWSIPLLAQNHHNYWFTGYEPNTPIEHLGGTTFDFSGDTLQIYKEDKPMSFSRTHGVMCDSAGKLLFYTNGMYIANAEHDTMVNGSGLNPGFWYNEIVIYHSQGYRITDGVLIFPDIKNDNAYKIFHICMPEFNTALPLQILATTVDMTGDDGLGVVTEKNKIVFQEAGTSLNQTHFHAVRHANGRDWWLVNMLYDSKELLLHLYTPDSIYRMHTQVHVPHSKAGVGQFQFSPDGSMLAISELRNISTAKRGHSLHLYAFDRCSGHFTPIVDNYVEDTIIFDNGVIFSPSGRYLYNNYHEHIFRYDTHASDILATKDTIATWDGYIWYPWEGSPPFRTRFGYGELGPDGNIYIMSSSASPFIHKITHPDDPSKSEVIQRIPIPTANSWTVPHYPNYKLGPLEGSPCAEMFGPPTAQFVYVPDALSVTYVDQSQGVPQSWYWDFGDGTTSQEQHPQHSYSFPGVYTVCLSAANIYGSDTWCREVEVETNSLQHPGLLSGGFLVQPNPAHRKVWVVLSEALTSEVTFLTLYDLLGRPVWREAYAGGDTVAIDLQALSPGMYFLQVQGREGRRWVEKVLVE
jgi:hypothetical protein